MWVVDPQIGIKGVEPSVPTLIGDGRGDVHLHAQAAVEAENYREDLDHAGLL
jgi:hypothetical protein